MQNEDAAYTPTVIRGTQLALIHLSLGWVNLHIWINRLQKQRVLAKPLAVPVGSISVRCPGPVQGPLPVDH